MGWRGRTSCLGAMVLAIVSCGAGPAIAQPTLVTPANAASFPRDANITFTVDLPPGGVDATLALSASPATDASGALASPISSFFEITVGSPGTDTWQPDDQAAGTYYWQASTFVCSGSPSYTCGNELSPVQSIVLTPLPAPSQVSPSDGATLTTGKSAKVSFNPQDQPDDSKLFVAFSRSSTVGSDGVLANPTATTDDLTSDEGLSTNISINIPAAADTPGVLYWQPVRVNCNDNPTSPCDVAGSVSELKLQKPPPPPPPPLKLRVTGTGTVHVGHPIVSWGVSCSEACSGTIRVRADAVHGTQFVAENALGFHEVRFSFRAKGSRVFSHSYSGASLAQLKRVLASGGSIRLQLTVAVAAKSGGAKATATHTTFIRPNPKPAAPSAPLGPDSSLTFSGNGSQNLGPIAVPVNSYLVWACDGCEGQFSVVSGVSSALNDISLQSSLGSGKDYVDAGTYPDVQIFTTGTWAISFAPAG
jgi:hypothetical protein